MFGLLSAPGSGLSTGLRSPSGPVSPGLTQTTHHEDPVNTWQLDTASVLQPKALLPTPGHRYCQPPPTFRGVPGPRPPLPLFPVPPPGSCLVPPPPLATDPGSGLVSPHSWHETTPGKAGDRWRKMSWAAGENVQVLDSKFGTGCVSSIPSSPPKPVHFNYQKPLHLSRPRTLLEVPLLQSKVQDTNEQKPSLIAALTGQQTAAGPFQSTLDPNSRPFTPASTKEPSPSPMSELIARSMEKQASPAMERPVTRESLNNPNRNMESCGLSFTSSDLEDISASESASFLELISASEKSLAMSNTSGLDSLSTSKYSEASKLAEDPLPEDPKSLLPQQLDSSFDENMENISRSSNDPKLSFLAADLPPPVFPFETWSGKRVIQTPKNFPGQGLLPTPKNFPNYGPKQTHKTEEEVSFPGSSSSSPKPRMIQGRGDVASAGFIQDLMRSTLGMTESIGLDFTRKSLPTQSRSRLGGKPTLPSTLNVGNLREVNELKNEDQGSLGLSWQKSLFDWEPELASLLSGSLIESYPVPDEYMTSRVIGQKLQPVKLLSCHTDLLFFLFYAYQEDMLQLVSASLLFERGWRYHKQDQVWLARWPGVTPERKTGEWEEGLYQYFDVKVWKRIPGWFRLNYDQLAEKPAVTEKDICLKQVCGKTWM